MDNNKKQKIDALWMDSDFGRWAIHASVGNTAEANQIAGKIFRDGYVGGLRQLEEEISAKLIPHFSSTKEWEDYLRAVDAENSDLGRFMIVRNLFEDVFNALYTKLNHTMSHKTG